MWLRIAPHLVEPLPVLLPTFPRGIQRRPLVALGLAINDIISADRNRGARASRRLPRSRLLSLHECVRLVPELESSSPTGGAIFFDARMYSAERLVLSVVQSAESAGAVIANYVKFVDPVVRKGKVRGALVRDSLADDTFEIRSRIIVNAAGPGAPAVAERLTGRTAATRHGYSVALNVMVAGQGHRVAFAIAGSSDAYRSAGYGVSRQLFFVPWRGHTLIGTGHYAYDGKPEEFQLDADLLERFVDEINRAWPGEFTTDDLQLVHSGLLPVEGGGSKPRVSLLKRHQILDHRKDGVPEAISAITVKFTTARLVAERAVDLVAKKLDRSVGPSTTAATPLPGAPERSVDDVLAEALERYATALDPEVLRHLVRFYGENYENVLKCKESLPNWDSRPAAGAPVIRAQWLHAVRSEMAQTAEDLVLRRTELGPRGMASPAVLASAARFLADQTRLEPSVLPPRPPSP